MKKQKSNKLKITINMQIALTFFCLLVLVIGVCIFVNSFFLEKYYIKNKLEVIKGAYELINETAIDSDNDSSPISSEIRSICDVYNINIIVIDESTDTVISSMNDSDRIQKQLFENMFGNGIMPPDDGKDEQPKLPSFEVLEQTNKYTIQIRSDVVMGNQYIEMWGVLDSGMMFLIRSSVESITDSVMIANKFLIYVGLGAAVTSILIAVWASRVISKPVSELTEISNHMRRLEFNVKYTGHARNEIGVLGDNINQLSETLENTISELKKANNQLERDLEQRTKTDEMRKEFLSNVSHELKTPIAVIQGYAEGLKMCINDDDESRDYYCDVIMDESKKMNSMVQKLLTLNQLEFGTDEVVFERFDIVEMIKEYLKTVDILIRAKDAKVTVEPESSVYVWGDMSRVYEVISNYFNNALNHLDGDRNIDIKIQNFEKSVRISVFNNGLPIPEESISKIWDKFYKVDKARTREYGGSGVGLSIVKAIQESINQPYGVINYNNGVEFYFELAKE